MTPSFCDDFSLQVVLGVERDHMMMNSRARSNLFSLAQLLIHAVIILSDAKILRGEEKVVVDILVLICTQSFTAEDLVEDHLLEALNDWTVEVALVDQANYDWSLLRQQQQEQQQFHARTLLVVASTYADGDPPNHAVEFANWLSVVEEREDPSSSIVVPPYAVFGLGDRGYPDYCAFAEFVDSSLELNKNGTRILPLHTGDALQDQSGAFDVWIQHLREVLVARHDLEGVASSEIGGREEVKTPSKGDYRRSAIQSNSVLARLESKQDLLTDARSSEDHRSVLHVNLTIPDHLVPANLQAGDYVGIYPRNPANLVSRALEWLGVDGKNAQVTLQDVPESISAEEFLTAHVDLAGRATPSTLRALLPFAGTLQWRALAKELTRLDANNLHHNVENNSTATVFDQWVSRRGGSRWANKFDLAVWFECRPSLQALARAVGPMQPRLYSVATIHRRKNETTIGLCIAVAEGGLCTHQYLANMQPGNPLAVFFRHTNFHFDVDDDTPAIFMAAGSGVGPYLGFLEQIEAAVGAAATPRTRLFLGCRTPADILYSERLAGFQKRVSLFNLHLAYSRLFGQPRRHVQDLLLQEAETVWDDVFQAGGKVFVCGRLEVCTGAKDALFKIALSAGGLSNSEAYKAVENLERDGRLLTDCWSVPSSPEQHRQLPDSNHNLLSILVEDEPRGKESSEPELDISNIPAWPSYLRLVASGEFERRIEQARNMTSSCVACGRFCEVNRLSSDSSDWGECRVGQQAIVWDAAPHFGEEDCLRGTKGSGTVFFGACNLKCVYCQNYQISFMDKGYLLDDNRLAELMLMLQEKGCHNINLVSPTHNVLAILRALFIAAKNGLKLPVVWNTGGYDSVASLRLLEGIVDIYMPDSKYASRTVARKLSKVDNYPEINQAAIKEMYRQVGDLQIDPRTGLAYRGVLVRHLVLPNDLGGTANIATFLANEVSSHTYTNVLPYYRPEHKALNDRKFGLARKPTTLELLQAHKAAKGAHLDRLHDEDKLCGGPDNAECLEVESH